MLLFTSTVSQVFPATSVTVGYAPSTIGMAEEGAVDVGGMGGRPGPLASHTRHVCPIRGNTVPPPVDVCFPVVVLFGVGAVAVREQRLVGLLEGLELDERLRIVWIEIGMELGGTLFVGLFDIGRGGHIAPFQTELCVRIVLFHAVRVGEIATIRRRVATTRRKHACA